MYVRDPLRVVVTGPLTAYAAGFCAELARQGYAPQPASELAQLMAHVSRWLDTHLGWNGSRRNAIEAGRRHVACCSALSRFPRS